MLKVAKINRLALGGLLLMAVFSFGNFTGQSLANIVVPMGVILFFVNRRYEKNQADYEALSFKTISTQLMNRENILWLIAPIAMTGLNVALSTTFLPEYIVYEKARAGAFISVEMSFTTIFLFFVFALGEEIAWRGFFQTQLMKWVKPILAMSLSSVLFTLGHFQLGHPGLVMYGLTFTLINGFLYGMIYYKTKNIWLSTIAHFLANVLEVFLITR